MLGFINASKYYETAEGLQIILNDATLLFDKSQRVGILGQLGAGKSTIIRLLAGHQALNQGILVNDGRSWPLGFAGMFHPALSASSNIQIVAQLLGLDGFELNAFCQDFAELSDAEYDAKMMTYSASMRAKLGFALSMAVPTDFYLADEIVGVGDEQFRMKCEVALSLRLEQSGLVFFSRNPRITQKICNRHGVLRDGKIIMCDSHEEASYYFEQE